MKEKTSKRVSVKDKMEPVLSLLPVQTAADTIRSFCIKIEKCSKCPIYNTKGKGCYFQNVTPDKWEIGDLVYERSELLSKNNMVRRQTK